MYLALGEVVMATTCFLTLDWSSQCALPASSGVVRTVTYIREREMRLQGYHRVTADFHTPAAEDRDVTRSTASGVDEMFRSR